MPTNTTAFSVGDLVRLTFTVKSTGSTLIDSDVKVIINAPSGSATLKSGTSTSSTSVLHDTTGTWHYDYKTTEAGRYTYRWVSTGAIAATTGGAWAVYPEKASS